MNLKNWLFRRKENPTPYPMADILLKSLKMRDEQARDQWKRLEHFLFEEKGMLFVWNSMDSSALPAATLYLISERLQAGRPLTGRKRLMNILARQDWQRFRDRKGLPYFFAVMEILIRHDAAFGHLQETIFTGGRPKRNKSQFYPSFLFDESPFGVVNNEPFAIAFLTRQANYARANGDEQRALRLLKYATGLCLDYDDDGIGTDDEHNVNYACVTECILSFDSPFTRANLFSGLINNLLARENNFWRLISPLITIWETAHKGRPLEDMPNFRKLQARIQETIVEFNELIENAQEDELSPDSRLLAVLRLYELNCLAGLEPFSAGRLKEIIDDANPESERFPMICEVLLKIVIKNDVFRDEALASRIDSLLFPSPDKARDFRCKGYAGLWAAVRPDRVNDAVCIFRDLLDETENDSSKAYVTGQFLILWHICGRIFLPEAMHETILQELEKMNARYFRDVVLDAKLWQTDSPFQKQVIARLFAGLAEEDSESKAYALEILLGMPDDGAAWRGGAVLSPAHAPLSGKTICKCAADETGAETDKDALLLQSLRSLPSNNEFLHSYACDKLMEAIGRYAMESPRSAAVQAVVLAGAKIALSGKKYRLLSWPALSLAGALLSAGSREQALSIVKDAIEVTFERHPNADLYNVATRLFRSNLSGKLRKQIVCALEKAPADYLNDLWQRGLREELAIFRMQEGRPDRGIKHLQEVGAHFLEKWADAFTEPFNNFEELQKAFLAEALAGVLRPIFEKYWDVPFHPFQNDNRKYTKVALMLGKLGDETPCRRLYDRTMQSLTQLGVDDDPHEINELWECLAEMGQFEDAWRHFIRLIRMGPQKLNDEEYPDKIHLLIKYFASLMGNYGVDDTGQWSEFLVLIKLQDNEKVREELYEEIASALGKASQKNAPLTGDLASLCLELAHLLKEAQDGISAISRHLIPVLEEHKDCPACVRALHEMALMVFAGPDIGEQRAAITALAEMGFATEARWRFDRLLDETLSLEDDRDAAYGLVEALEMARKLEYDDLEAKLLSSALKRAMHIENRESRDHVLSHLHGALPSGKYMKERKKIIAALNESRQTIDYLRIQAMDLCRTGRFEEARQNLLLLAGDVNFEPASLVDYISNPEELQWLAGEILKKMNALTPKD